MSDKTKPSLRHHQTSRYGLVAPKAPLPQKQTERVRYIVLCHCSVCYSNYTVSSDNSIVQSTLYCCQEGCYSGPNQKNMSLVISISIRLLVSVSVWYEQEKCYTSNEVRNDWRLV
jgi:hypothetical protein